VGHPLPVDVDIRFKDRGLAGAWDRFKAGERMTLADDIVMLETEDVLALGRMADAYRTALHGDRTYFVFNRQLNPTNKCVLDCVFCDYAKSPTDTHGYEMDMEQILAHGEGGIREIHMVGGLHPKWKYEQYVDIVRQLRAHYPDLQIKAWTAVEIDWFARLSRKSVEAVFEDMVAAGMNSMPGGGAEVFSERVRQALFKQKIGADRWLEIHRIAHRMGIPSNATLLFGHIETYEERVQHILRLRDLEDEAPGFLAFIPLEFQKGYTNLVERQASALEDLKTIAMSRLVWDNVPHVKSYWVMLGDETASMGLNFGASDIDGTIGEEKIAHAALAASPLGLARERLVELIREAGKTPVERDALYNVVQVYDAVPA